MPRSDAHPRTPDGRYFVVRGRLWRLSDPALAPAEREALVREAPRRDRVTTGFGGNVRRDPPYAVRRFRHPGTGEEAVLSVRVVHPPGGPFHEVELCRPDRSPVPDVMFSTWAGDIKQAREVWAQRQRELLAAGYERV